MINRDLIRRKIVQLTYAYYQNGNRNMDNAEKELFFSLSKAYDLYNYQLQLIVEITKEARKRYDLEVTRVQLRVLLRAAWSSSLRVAVFSLSRRTIWTVLLSVLLSNQV